MDLREKIRKPNEPPVESRELQKRSIIDLGACSFAQSYIFDTLLVRACITGMDHVCSYLMDYEKINLFKFKPLEASLMQNLIAKLSSKEFSKLETYQLDSAENGMQSSPEKALLKLASAKRICSQILSSIKTKTSLYGGKISIFNDINSKSGGTGIVTGTMAQFLVQREYDPEFNEQTTVIPSLPDGIKYKNRQITMANDLRQKWQNKDIVFLQDNNIANSIRTIGQLDLRESAVIEAIRKAKSLKGTSDFSDRISCLRDSGNGTAMIASATLTLAQHKRLFRKRAINGNVMSEVLAQTFTEFCTQKGFDRWGHLKAREVKPVYLGIYGKIPETIVLEARDSAGIGEDMDVFYIQTGVFGNELLIFGVYTTTHSIDSIDALFGLPLDGVRKAEHPDQLVPKDVLEDFSGRVFPNSKNGTDYMTVIDRVANICEADPEEVLKA